jgi:hypothetical protein
VGYFLTDDSPTVRAVAHVLSWVLPRLDLFTVADHVVYGDFVAPDEFFFILAYSLAYTGILLLLSIALFARREFT